MEQALINLDSLNLSEEELFSFVDNSAATTEKITAPRYSYWKSVGRVFFKRKINVILLALLLVVILFAFVIPLFSPFDMWENLTEAGAKNLTPFQAISKWGFHIKWILGTGQQGESTFNAIWYGSRISLSLSLVCAVINLVIGIVLGAIWGYSKHFDLFMTEVYNIVGNVPYILVISVLVVITGAGFWPFVFALTVTGWLGIAYFIRTQVIIIRDREYNLASRCLGTNIIRVTIKNILPFLTSVIVTLAAAEIPSYISMEVFLSYIGMGMSDTTLGKLIENSQKVMAINAWEFWSPVLLSSIVTIVLYVLGQNLGDASDPRTHM